MAEGIDSPSGHGRPLWFPHVQRSDDNLILLVSRCVASCRIFLTFVCFGWHVFQVVGGKWFSRWSLHSRLVFPKPLICVSLHNLLLYVLHFIISSAVSRWWLSRISYSLRYCIYCLSIPVVVNNPKSVTTTERAEIETLIKIDLRVGNAL